MAEMHASMYLVPGTWHGIIVRAHHSFSEAHPELEVTWGQLEVN